MKNLIYLSILFVLSSCAGSKMSKTLEQGSVVQENFKTTIPFEYKHGLIILKVEIQGATYDFILDTGASNVLSKELADKLAVVPLGSEDIYDIHDESQSIEYTKLDAVTLNGIDFIDTIAAIVDFNKIPELACLEIDGFIGANLMRRAVWDFDFKNQTITITNDENKLNLPSDYIESKLFIGHAGLASIITKVNGKRALNNVIDFGNNGPIRLPYPTFKKQKKTNQIAKYIKGSGFNGTGIYGKGEKRSFYNAKIDEIKIGEHIIKDEIAFIDGGSGNLGIEFFKNYRVILNWSTRRIKMIKKESKAINEFKSFGFKKVFRDNKLFIGTLFQETNASKLLELGDQIIEINNKDYSHVTQEGLCEINKNGLVDYSANSITVKVLRNENELVFQLDKKALL